MATRPDLLDRAICLTLPEIKDEQRRDESALWAEFERIRPHVLGALLDAVAAALCNVPDTQLASMPRMADFALWATAAERALPWDQGAFLAAYTGNRGAANELALASSIIGGPLLSLTAGAGFWEGTARELLDALEDGHADDKIKKHKEWPASPRKLSGELRRLAPNLRRSGVDVTFDREPGGRRRRMIRLEKTCNTPSQPSRPSQSQESAGETPGRSRDDRDGRTPHAGPHRPAENPVSSAIRDGRDGRDGALRADSDCPENEGEVVEWTA